MYRPKSPVATPKKIIFSPSPVAKRKALPMRGTPVNQPSPKQRPNPVNCENKPLRKMPMPTSKRPPVKNI